MENYATAETAQKADTDPEGCFAVAVAADNSATGARVVWVNCPNLLESNINQPSPAATPNSWAALSTG